VAVSLTASSLLFPRFPVAAFAAVVDERHASGKEVWEDERQIAVRTGLAELLGQIQR